MNHNGACVYTTDYTWDRACALHSRGTAHPICELGVGWSLLNSSILLLFRQPLTSSIIVFTSSPTCLLVQTITIDLMAMKDYFFSASVPNNPPFLPVGALWLLVIAQWLCSIPRAPENMSHKNIITIHFHIWTWYIPTILISRACHGFSIKIYLSTGGIADIVTQVDKLKFWAGTY